MVRVAGTTLALVVAVALCLLLVPTPADAQPGRSGGGGKPGGNAGQGHSSAGPDRGGDAKGPSASRKASRPSKRADAGNVGRPSGRSSGRSGPPGSSAGNRGRAHEGPRDEGSGGFTLQSTDADGADGRSDADERGNRRGGPDTDRGRAGSPEPRDHVNGRGTEQDRRLGNEEAPRVNSDRPAPGERSPRAGSGGAEGAPAPAGSGGPGAAGGGTPSAPTTVPPPTSDPATPPTGDPGTPPDIDPGTPPALLGFGGVTMGDLEAFSGRSPVGRALLDPPFVPGPGTVGGVPILLALLGAFLALQRGIGRGLGHVPMAPETTTQTAHDPS